MNTVEQVEAVIRRLPRKARQQVAERLNAQLWPSGFAPEVETAWADTVKRRWVLLPVVTSPSTTK